MLATPADPFDPMEAAIQDFGRRWLAGTEHVHDDVAPEFEYPLSPEILRHDARVRGRRRRRGTCWRPRARRRRSPTSVTSTPRGATHCGSRSSAWPRAGCACSASRWGDGTRRRTGARDAVAPSWPASQHDFDFRFLGLVGLADPPRPEVPAALAQCREPACA